jgi:hypothetical protein
VQEEVQIRSDVKHGKPHRLDSRTSRPHSLDPVSEADPVPIRPPTEVDDDTQDDQPDDRQHLDRRSDKLALSVPLDPEEVDRADEHEKDGDPYGRVDLLIRVPIRNNDRYSGKFYRGGDSPGIPVVVTQGETHGGVDETGGHVRDGSGDGEEGA